MSFLLKITKYHFKGLSSGSPWYFLEGFLCYSPTIPFGWCWRRRTSLCFPKDHQRSWLEDASSHGWDYRELMTILLNMVTNGKISVETGQPWNLGTIRRPMKGLRMNQNHSQGYRPFSKTSAGSRDELFVNHFLKFFLRDVGDLTDRILQRYVRLGVKVEPRPNTNRKSYFFGRVGAIGNQSSFFNTER